MDSLITWPLPPVGLRLGQRSVHIWAWDHRCSPDALLAYQAILSPDEVIRGTQFHFETDRVRYVISHAKVRILLGKCLGIEPSSIAFKRGKFGKPYILSPLANQGLNFNLSHTRHIGTLAIALGLAVGIDIEEINSIDPGIVERYFSHQEQMTLGKLTGAARLDGFYSCWTKKEAVLKAEGVGLNVRLDAFSVSLGPTATVQEINVRDLAGFTSNWHLIDLRPSLGSIGALATDIAPAEVYLYQSPNDFTYL